jgi:putative heme-binding domain-containing protein
MNNIHGQRLNMDVLKPQGSGYTGGHGPDFLLTGDQASQILNLRYGPDGQAWMIDWYDMQACHRRESSVHDRSNGRIYKIAYGELAHVKVDLQKWNDGDLAELVLHKNDWYVRHARRILQERSATRAIQADAIERLVEIATSHADDTRRLRAAWVLHVTNQLNDALSKQLLVDPSPFVRGWAIQLDLERSENDLSTIQVIQFTIMAQADDSPIVRLYLASAMQRIPLAQRWSILEGLASHAEDARDHNLPLMIWYAAEPLADVDQKHALDFGLAAGEQIPLLRDFMLRRIGSSEAANSLDVLVAGLDKAYADDLRLTYLKAIRAALQGRRQVAAPKRWKFAYRYIMRSENAEVRLQATALGVTFGDQEAMSQLREMINTKSAGIDARAEALEALLAAKDAQLVPTLHKLIGEPALRQAALRGLAQYDDSQTADVVLTAYPRLSPSERRSALATLCSRAPYGIALLNAIDNKRVPGTDLTADLVRQLQYLKNETIDQQLLAVWGSVRDTSASKAKLIASYKAMLAGPGQADVNLGRAVFAKTCQNCHMLYGVGRKVGPDLTGSNRSNLDYLLSNVVDPSAVMAKEYRSTVIVTTDGRLVTGLVLDENNSALTVQTADAIVVVPKAEIEERELSTKSMMPENQLQQFNEHQIRSLVAYLTDRQQVPMLATANNAALLFNGHDLTGWSGDPELWSVEDGEIVGRTSGLARNDWIVSALTARDFRLKLEVKLVGNNGNSGIQFRSHSVGREVSGYQADIGQGWWGKLYEEHGRALLWGESGEEHVKLDDWNSYEIVAVGSKIQTFINGQLCVNLDDPQGKRQGIIAFQLHSGGKTEVRFRHLSLEVLDPDGKPVARE